MGAERILDQEGLMGKAKPYSVFPAESAVTESGVRTCLPRVWEDEDDTDESISTALALPPANATKRPRLMMMTGARAGELITLDGRDDFAIGRSVDAEIQVDDPSISRRHCLLLHREGRLHLEDLESRNGTRVNGVKVKSAQLSDGDRLQVGSNTVFQVRFVDEVEDELARRLVEASIRDPLTGAYNRRYLHRRLEAEVSYARRYGTGLACIILDLDFFKAVNDTYGHHVGDAVLATVGRALEACIRNEDVVTRLGGEEFALLARVNSIDEARAFAERVRGCIQGLRIAMPSTRQTIGVTVSAGVAELGELDKDARDGGALIALADERLYDAKAAGRNRVEGGSATSVVVTRNR
jgi:diguanylate cyclase (GGDEF)-like protein